VHVVADDRGRYPLRPGGFGRVWWDRACDVDVLLGGMDAAGVDRAVVVQAVGPYGFDNGYLLDVVADHPDRLVGIVAVDLDDPGARRQVADLVAHPGVAGVRCFAVGERAEWVADGRVLGDVLDASPTVVLTAFPDQLDRLVPVLTDHSGTPVAVDHAGFPDWSAGPPFPVLDRLAELPHVTVKLTGHLLETAPNPRAAFAYFAELFGSHRIVAGSDWPQSGPTYVAMWDEVGSIAGPEHVARRFLGTNAAALWPGDHPGDPSPPVATAATARTSTSPFDPKGSPP
jgi:predicted TIM-barrel fold metal-dependent hydrolase